MTWYALASYSINGSFFLLQYLTSSFTSDGGDGNPSSAKYADAITMARLLPPLSRCTYHDYSRVISSHF